MYPVIPYKVFSSWNSKVITIISAEREGIFEKKSCKMREENPTLPKSCKQGVQIKRPNFLRSVSPSLSILWHPTKIGIWLSSNPSRIIIRLGNIGNQGMRHSPYLQTPHISLRSRKKRVKILTPCEDRTPWVSREYHWETWTSFEKVLQNSELGTWTNNRKHSGEGCSVLQPPKTKGWKQIRPILQNLRYEPTYS